MVHESDPQSFVVHSGNEIIYTDEAFLTLIGADSRDQILGKSLIEIVAQEYHESFEDQVRKIRAGDAPTLGLRLSLQTTTGRSHEVIALSSPVQWEGTEQVQTVFLNLANQIQESQMTLRDRAMNQAPIGITIADASQPDEPLIYANDGFIELTGYPRENILGRNCRFLQGEQTRQEPVNEMREAIENEEPVTVELRNYRKDGEMFWNRVSLTPIKTQSGEVSHYFGFQEDITETKIHEQEKTLFEKQAEVAEQAMFITDREGVIEYVNPAFEHQTGYLADEAIGQTPSILNSGKQDESFYQDLWETITADETWTGELTNETKGGELYEIKLTIVPITDDHGRITHFAAIENEITDKILREQALSVLNRVLRHNLRTAINVIEGQTEMLELDMDYIDHQAAIEAIQNQTDAMRKIANKTDKVRNVWKREDHEEVWRISHMETLVQTHQQNYPDAEIELTIDVTDDFQLPKRVPQKT